ncbi:MAG: hypothetical protein WCO03_01080 [bacterium]
MELEHQSIYRNPLFWLMIFLGLVVLALGYGGKYYREHRSKYDTTTSEGRLQKLAEMEALAPPRTSTAAERAQKLISIEKTIPLSTSTKGERIKKLEALDNSFNK